MKKEIKNIVAITVGSFFIGFLFFPAWIITLFFGLILISLWVLKVISPIEYNKRFQ